MLTILLGFCNNKVVLRSCDVCLRWTIYLGDFSTPNWTIAAMAYYCWALCGPNLLHLLPGLKKMSGWTLTSCAGGCSSYGQCVQVLEKEFFMDEAVTSQDRMIIFSARITFRITFFFQFK